MIKDYEFYVADDVSKFNRPATKGSFVESAKIEAQVPFPPTTGRYIKLKALSALSGEPYTTIAELSVYGE
jgi:hypothetical protein